MNIKNINQLRQSDVKYLDVCHESWSILDPGGDAPFARRQRLQFADQTPETVQLQWSQMDFGWRLFRLFVLIRILLWIR